ncbi:LrgB family protein [Christiangramia fulva]|uniref:LrgB family protein n=1 Tax=Christiangramia fulva TaxID=2126553 RepID=A0A2R3ZA39_9FLAO|nr:LrgB family protein [Christiangramia fulva]AVR47129.1 LrgB family protein [Christiangramia fulva]
MILFFSIHLFGGVLTVMCYYLALKINKEIRLPFLNPVLMAIVLIITFLFISNIDFTDYKVGASYLEMFLAPSVVAMGVFLHERFNEIKKRLKIFVCAVFFGGISGIISMVLFLLFLDTPQILIQSLAAKSVTTPIAIEITKLLGGLPEITAGMVILVGIFGNVFGTSFLMGLGIRDEAAIGTALGTAAHGIGTARAFEIGEVAGVYSGLAMCLNGIITSILTPYVLDWFL